MCMCIICANMWFGRACGPFAGKQTHTLIAHSADHKRIYSTRMKAKTQQLSYALCRVNIVADQRYTAKEQEGQHENVQFLYLCCTECIIPIIDIICLLTNVLFYNHHRQIVPGAGHTHPHVNSFHRSQSNPIHDRTNSCVINQQNELRPVQRTEHCTNYVCRFALDVARTDDGEQVCTANKQTRCVYSSTAGRM